MIPDRIQQAFMNFCKSFLYPNIVIHNAMPGGVPKPKYNFHVELAFCDCFEPTPASFI